MPEERRRRSGVSQNTGTTRQLAGREYAARGGTPMPENRYGAPGEQQPRRRQDIYVRQGAAQTHFYDDMAPTRGREPSGKVSGRGYRGGERRHTGLWLCLSILFAALLALLALLMLPQLTGVHIAGLPAIAFNGGSIITYNETTVGNYQAARAHMNTDTFFDGITVDGVDLSGMTMAQAREALSGVSASGSGSFSYTIHIGGDTWTIDSDMVPMSRDTEEVLAKAWAIGRSNTQSIRGTRTTPFQERVNQAAALQSSPVSFTTSVTYDKSRVREIVNAISDQVCVAPVDASVASFDFGSKSFTFNADSSGITIDAESVYNQIVDALARGEKSATITVQPETVLASVTKSELMNSFCRVSYYSTKTTSNSNRNTNIRLAAEAINGMVVMPGETFSFNSATGQRTEEKGYKPAAAISGGSTSDEVGGGVCQVSSTLFNAVARANLEIVSRSPHAWPSSYVSEGMDATVNWPSLDFKWRNNSDWPVYIVAWYKDQKVYVELYGYGLGDGLSIDLVSYKTKTIEASDEVKLVQNESLPAGTRNTTVKKRDGSVWETYQVWYRNGQ